MCFVLFFNTDQSTPDNERFARRSSYSKICPTDNGMKLLYGSRDVDFVDVDSQPSHDAPYRNETGDSCTGIVMLGLPNMYLCVG